MTSLEHGRFIDYINSSTPILEAHRISGDGCYHLKFKVKNNEQLNDLLQNLLSYGNYSLYLSVNKIEHIQRKDHKYL
nr:Lrp/AsnC ligand binding domain-containing protein [Staphylococcus sp. NAM3COL9]